MSCRSQDISYYLPQVVKVDRTPQGRKIRSVIPLFTGYLFLLGDEYARVEALRSNRLANVLEIADQESLIHDLRQIHQMLSSGLAVVPEPVMPVGRGSGSRPARSAGSRGPSSAAASATSSSRSSSSWAGGRPSTSRTGRSSGSRTTPRCRCAPEADAPRPRRCRSANLGEALHDCWTFAARWIMIRFVGDVTFEGRAGSGRDYPCR